MQRARIRRRRRLALAVLIGLAGVAFAFGAALGNGDPRRPSVASTLPLRQLVGERLLTGVCGRRSAAGRSPE
jgi:hypothetical protein